VTEAKHRAALWHHVWQDENKEIRQTRLKWRYKIVKNRTITRLYLRTAIALLLKIEANAEAPASHQNERMLRTAL
jgi:hypothetical protein